ncbi:hypothetical protein DCC81_05145 [Chitinophaga parva]|uniref:Lipoprotein n=1 Tax=Chitinophaga parva TaxID=2169414 RepID=A0A2T7BMF8_9BACT|nr:hypothetical protein [Chitinophaga parva]PUZ28868.1 hypothetical protein DCC81_05145 [Chitinophaga parva]
MKTYFSTNRVVATAALSLATITVFFACKKNNNDANSTSNVVATNNAIASISNESAASAGFSDVFEVSFNGTKDMTEARTSTASQEPSVQYGFEISYTPVDNTWPKTVTLDFKNGSIGLDGKKRSGQLIITLPHPFLVANNTVTITSTNYTVDGVKLVGTETLTSGNLTSALKYTQVISGTVTVGDTTTYTYNSNKTLIVDTDGFKGIGFAALKYPTGDSAAITVTDTLVKAWDCRWIGKGKATVVRGKLTGTIDYGNGICDDSATVVVGNYTKMIKL